jgi:hypothetical protein
MPPIIPGSEIVKCKMPLYGFFFANILYDLCIHGNGMPSVQCKCVLLKLFLFLLLFRADELETALMEMVKQDNRRQLSAKV